MKKLFFLIPAALLAVAVSCSKEVVPDSLAVDKTELSASAEGGSSSIVITSNVKWTITPVEACDWVTLSKTSGEGNADVLFTFAANTKVGRKAAFTVAGGSCDPITINVSQESAKSDMRLGTPYLSAAPVLGEANKVSVTVPYTNALGTEEVSFSVSVTGTAAAGFEASTVTVNTFAEGNGEVQVPVNGTPAALGPITIAIKAGDDDLTPIEVRVCEPRRHENMVSWNFWSIGYTRDDFNLLRGSKYDKSWTSEAVNPTTSGVGTDHVILPAFATDSANDAAYLSLYCQNPIVAAGDDGDKPNGTPTGLTGYQFNPGIQIQGMVKDDYVFVYIPAASASKTITVETALGGAKAAANAFVIEYSTDNKTWTAFDGAKDMVISDVHYAYHTAYNTTYNTRYVYAHDATLDQTYVAATATLATALKGGLYVRLRANGVNGAGAVMTGTGWTDIKFIEVSFE